MSEQDPLPPPFELDEEGKVLYVETTNSKGETVNRTVPWSSEKVIEVIGNVTDTVLLSFSRGKDALAAWLAIRDHFTVVPFYMYSTPDLLSFEEESLQYYEKFFNTHIYRVPLPWVWEALKSHVFQPPQRLRPIDAMNLYVGSHDELEENLIKELGLPMETFTAKGILAIDSPNRWATCYHSGQGPINWSRCSFYPVWDWSYKRLYQAFDEVGVKLPRDYELFGRTFDGYDHRFIEPLRQHCPEDYEKVREWSPLLDLDWARWEFTKMRQEA
jgi:hypothetical protein